jgi:hypothetical protein
MTKIATANTATGQLTLESVQQAFHHWRNSPNRNKKKIPEYLWRQVEKILPHYRQCQILTALSLNHKQLHRNINVTPTSALSAPTAASADRTKPKEPQPSAAPSPAFVKTFLPTSPESASSYHVEWQRPDGAKLTITQLDAAGLRVLVEHWRA